MKTRMQLRNYSAILADDVVTVTCTYFTSPDMKPYTFLCKRDLALTLEKGDTVIAQNDRKSPKDGSAAIVYVHSVHREVVLDDPENIEYRWVYQKVDVAEGERLVEQQNRFADDMYAKQRRRAQLAAATELGYAEGETPAISFSEPDVTEDAVVIE